jgi:hypothetical protein
MDEETYSLCETVADLALWAGHDLAKGLWKRPPDSRELVRLLIEWSEEFERDNAGREWDGEYLEAIDSFYRQKIKELSQTT